MNASPHSLLFGVLLIGLLVLPTSAVWGYRPFVSTDAAVANPNAFEIELGLFQLAERDSRGYSVSSQVAGANSSWGLISLALIPWR